MERLKENYPSDLTEGYPNVGKTDVFTKERLLRKLKCIKLSFRKAVDSGRRSGGGSVVMALYDECYEVWAGSPAVESLDQGIETATQDKEDSLDSEEKDTQDSMQSSSSSPSHHQDQDSENEEENEQSTGSRAVIKDMGKARRELLKNIKEKKDSKLTK